MHHTLEVLADLYNPTLFASAIAFTFWYSRSKTQKTRAAIFYLFELTLYLVLVYGLQYIDNRIDLWPRFNLDYSTHSAFAVAMIWPLWRHQSCLWRWLWPVSFGLYAALMIYMGYHTLEDIISTSAVLIILFLGIRYLLHKKISALV